MLYEREEGCQAWLAYARCRPQAILDLLAEMGSAEAVYDLTLRDRGSKLREHLTPKQTERLLEAAKPDAMHRMMVAMRDHRIRILSQDDFLYSDCLRSIPDAPVFLFYQGDASCMEGKSLTVVGARMASPKAIAHCEQICRNLSESGITIVSGLAPGIDTAAHRGSMMGPTPGIGVMACGLDIDYPVVSHQLKRDLLNQGGLILSEVPPGVRVYPGAFPQRNRIVSGLGRGVVLMEAKIKSGSMNTVQHALDQGRDVFAWPGEPGSDWSEGTHQLIREGARYFVTAADLLEDMGWDGQTPLSADQKTALPALSPEMHKILTILHQGEKGMDELAAESGLDASILAGTLTMLQMYGCIRALPGKTYCLQ